MSKAKPDHRVLPGWSPNVIAKGSPEEIRHVDRLLDKMTDTQFDFMSYSDEMKDWKNPSELQTKLDKTNETYCRYMLDMCADPLSHGVNRDSIMEAVGMYVGMTLFSKDFKKTVNRDVANTIFPVAEKLVRVNAKLSDTFARGHQRFVAGIESVTGKESPGNDKLFNRIPAQETAEIYLADLQGQVMAANNHGRIPFTPESAATMHLNFGFQAYEAMRKPGADIADIKQNYTNATETLKYLSALDGIDEDQLDRNIRAVYGKVSMRYPDVARMFEETMFDDVELAQGDIEVGADKIRRSVWRGEFKTKSGEPYTGDFTPREPVTREQWEARAAMCFGMAYESCPTLDSVQDIWRRGAFEDSILLMEQAMNEDAGAFPETEDRRTPMEVIFDANIKAAKVWADMHEPSESEKAQAKDQQRGRDTSGLGDFGPEYESGPEYC